MYVSMYIKETVSNLMVYAQSASTVISGRLKRVRKRERERVCACVCVPPAPLLLL